MIAELRSHEVSVDGVRTHYLEGGAQGGATIVLLHDGMFGANGALTWSPVLSMLAERYHVFAPDQIGYGKTQKIYDFGVSARTQRIEHLAKWMKAADVRDAHVLGNSASGSLILHAAVQTSWPMMVSGVSIAGTGGPFMQMKAYEPLQSYVPDRDKMRAIMELMVARRDDAFDQLVTDRYVESMVRGHWENLSAPRLRAPGGSRSPSDGDDAFLTQLSTVKLPLLLIAGERDVLLEPAWEAQLATRLENARTLNIAGTFHQPQIDEPERIADAIDAFIESIS